MTNNTFRLFISSTFSDFNEERRLLQTYVFPEIKKYCIDKGGYTFQPIDLRWGVSNEAQLDQKTLELCIDEVKASKNSPHPNFLIMAGDRYGWVPCPYAIEQSEFEKILEHVKSNNNDIEIEYCSYQDNDGQTQHSSNRNTNKVELLEQWYKLDENQIPASYILEERINNEYGDYTIYENWGSEENYLRDILQEAADNIFTDKEDKEYKKYFTSATEHEVIDGIFKYLHITPHQEKLKAKDKEYAINDEEYVYGYVRDIESIGNETFTDSFKDKDSSDINSKVEQFKQTLKNSIKKENLLNVQANISNLSRDDKNGSLNYSYEAIENEENSLFVQQMIKYLKSSIDAFTSQEYTPEEIESFEQERFKDDKLKLFIGREKPLQAIDEYITNDNNQPFIIFGRSGLGKSALVAKAVDNALNTYKDKKIVYKFVGSTATLNDSPSLLISILKEFGIEEEIRKEINTQTGEEENEKLEEFYRRINERIQSIKDNTIIFIDAVDQLSNEDEFLWLPNELSLNIKIVISALEDEKYKDDSHYFDLLKIKTYNLYQLNSFENSKELIISKLKEYNRTITNSQMEYLQAQTDSKSPLYLTIAAQELRHWKSTDLTKEYKSNDTGQDLAPTQKEIIHEYIENLTDVYHHDKEFVKKVLSYLYLTDGLAESELLDIINIDEEFVKYLSPDTFHNNVTKELPIVIWARLHTQIKEFLKLKETDGYETMSFFHREFNTVVATQYDIISSLELLTKLLLFKYQESLYGNNRWGKLFTKSESRLYKNKTTMPYNIIVFSSFADFVQERDFLVESVFNEIEKYAKSNGVNLNFIILNYGINEYSPDQNHGDFLRYICSQKNTLTLFFFGNRYGWVPLPYSIEENEFQKISDYLHNIEDLRILQEWYILDQNKIPVQYTLRSLNIIDEFHLKLRKEDILRNILQQAARVVFKEEDKVYKKYFTSITEHEFNTTLEYGDLNSTIAIFRDLNTDNFKFIDQNSHNIKHLKYTAQKQLPMNNIFQYEIDQPIIDENGITDEHYFSYLKEDTLNQLKNNLVNKISSNSYLSDLEQELLEQNKFKASMSIFFIGREKEIANLDNYINNNSNHSLLLCGYSSVGKSALIAKMIEYITTRHINLKLCYRFIGATVTSNNLENILKSIMTELNDGVFEPNENELYIQVNEYLQAITEPTIIILDGFDSLSEKDDLKWLPTILPSNLKIILSTSFDESDEISKYYYNTILKKVKNNQLEIFNPTINEIKTSVDTELLNSYNLRLTKFQEHYLIDYLQKSPYPYLSLKVSLEIVSQWKSYEDNVKLPNDFEDMFFEYCENLLINHGFNKELLFRLFGYIASSKSGITENSLIGIMSTDKNILISMSNSFDKTTENARKTKIILYSNIIRLLFHLEPFIKITYINGEKIITIQQKAIYNLLYKKAYLPEKEYFQKRLIEYFS